MAYFDQDEYGRFWHTEILKADRDAHVHLPGTAEELEGDVLEAESARAYVVRDWFGPFLLASSRRYLRGRC